MAETLDTTEQVYRRFLDLIKRESTGIVPPVVFNRIANDAQDDWLAGKLSEIEKDQKKIDDLRVIRVRTPNGVPVLAATGSKTYPLPDGVILDVDGVTPLAMYKRLLRVAFKITYVDNDCGLTGISDWIRDTKVLRSDQSNWIMTSPHRKPSDKKIYYEQTGNIVRIETNSSSTAYQMQLDYLRPPSVFNYDPLFPLVDNFEFPNQQKDEIIDRCVQIHLERLKDERYKSWIQEEYMKYQSK